jgi:hypothetical protein
VNAQGQHLFLSVPHDQFPFVASLILLMLAHRVWGIPSQ